MWGERAHLLETDGGSLLAEALTAEVKAVLADETSLVGAEAAAKRGRSAYTPRPARPSPSFQLPSSKTLSGRCHLSHIQEQRMLTTDGYPCRTCGDERTKRRRGSFWLVLKEKELQGNTQTHSSESYKKVRGRGGGQYLVRGVCGGLAVGVVVRAIICVVLYSPSPG